MIKEEISVNIIENHKELLEKELKELQEEIKRSRDIKNGLNQSMRCAKNELLVTTADLQNQVGKVKKIIESIG